MSNPDEKSAKRYPNVYDAVAGRVSRKKFYANHSSTSASHQTKSSYAITPALTPDELLFRRSTAPIRYMENDHYFANKEIPLDQSLPDSDLLKAIHLYTSELYEYNTDDKGLSAWRSMDETALIALGFLLEELSTDALEETGDMVFVEGEEVTDFGEMSDSDGGMSTGLSSRRRSVSTIAQTPSRVHTYSSQFDTNTEALVRFRTEMRGRRKGSKRRRLMAASKVSDSEGLST